MHLTQVDGTSLDGKEAVTEGDLFNKKKKKEKRPKFEKPQKKKKKMIKRGLKKKKKEEKPDTVPTPQRLYRISENSTIVLSSRIAGRRVQEVQELQCLQTTNPIQKE